MTSPSGQLPLLERLGLHRPELRAWAMYDWAITAFYAVVIVAVFPIYFQDVAASGLDDATASSRLSTITAIALAIAAAIAPIFGAITDYLAVKKRFLGLFAGVGVAAVAGMFFIHEGDLLLASILFIFANIGANGSMIFYDALLPHLASEKEVDRVSSAGFAVGYCGATLVLIATLVLVTQPQLFGFAEGSTLPARLSFVGIALWWALFTVPLMLRVPEPPLETDDVERTVAQALRAGLSGLRRTFGELRNFRHAFLFLIAFFIYNDGISTIIRLATSYGTELGFEQGLLIGSIIVVQVVAIPCTFAFGAIAGWIGTKNTLFGGLVVYMLISILGYFMTTAVHFVALAAMVGMVQGGTQALSRSLFASMIPRYLSGRFFGFFAVFERFSGILGPAVFAIVGLTAGSSRPAILSIIVFFIIGGALLFFVDIDEGRRVAREREAQMKGSK